MDTSCFFLAIEILSPLVIFRLFLSQAENLIKSERIPFRPRTWHLTAGSWKIMFHETTKNQTKHTKQISKDTNKQRKPNKQNKACNKPTKEPNQPHKPNTHGQQTQQNTTKQKEQTITKKRTRNSTKQTTLTKPTKKNEPNKPNEKTMSRKQQTTHKHRTKTAKTRPTSNPNANAPPVSDPRPFQRQQGGVFAEKTQRKVSAGGRFSCTFVVPWVQLPFPKQKVQLTWPVSCKPANFFCTLFGPENNLEGEPRRKKCKVCPLAGGDKMEGQGKVRLITMGNEKSDDTKSHCLPTALTIKSKVGFPKAQFCTGSVCWPVDSCGK